ncbi:MAG: SUMF1/EgtB/PvdO family nonheme iron enzyme, partial [Pseudomonadota bacterium]|nr:SUMF1/EgtB/PvdO family nonheme iron enzyme [Pseudomonadota bacterium]
MKVFWIVLPLALLGCDQKSAPPPQVVTVPAGMVLIPAGEFLMGSNQVDDSGKQAEFGFREPMYLDEHPQHRVMVSAFYIDEHEVKSVDYKQFTLETGVEPPQPWVQNGYNVNQVRLSEFDVGTLRQIATDYFQLDMDSSKLDKTRLLA